MHWQVQLMGDARDLEYLVMTLEAGSRRVLRDLQQPGYLYESDSFNVCTTSEQVDRIAREEIAVLSGVVRVTRDARDSLGYGGIYRINQQGGRDIFVAIREGVQARAEVGAVVAVVTDASGAILVRPQPVPRSAALLQLASADSAVAKIMRLMSAADAATWSGLYRTCEVIEEAVGGHHRLGKQGWGSEDGLRRFKHSANSVQVGGDESRHGKEPQTPPMNPMTLAEADAYVKYLVQAWLASKGA